MNTEERLSLIKRNTVEIIKEDKIKNFMKKGTVYCGYECSGEIHLGHFVTIMKLLDLQKAGIKVKVLLADWHTWLNKKGDWTFVERQLKQWEKGFRSVGLEAEIVRGTSYQKTPEYFEDILKLALETTINRGVRSMQQVARDIENAKVSQVIYPLMQVADVKHLKTNFVVAGSDQRKIYMLGLDEGDNIGLKDAVYLYTPLIPGLKGPGTKMSSSVKNSFISIRDSKKEIEKKINGAYCKQGDVENNPILSIAKLIVVPMFDKIDVSRPEKFGGNVSFESYKQLEKAFESGELHAQDLKNALSVYLEKIIAPIRKQWK